MTAREKLLEFKNKITSGPWEVGAMEIQFIRNWMPPSYNKVQPTLADLEFISFVRNAIDQIIEELEIGQSKAEVKDKKNERFYDLDDIRHSWVNIDELMDSLIRERNRVVALGGENITISAEEKYGYYEEKWWEYSTNYEVEETHEAHQKRLATEERRRVRNEVSIKRAAEAKKKKERTTYERLRKKFETK